MRADPQPSHEDHPRVLMLGKGWFPDQLGGLDRYFRDLLEHLPESAGVVIGPANERPRRVAAVSSHPAPLAARLLAFGAAGHRAGRDAQVVDVHFALYALLPLLSRRLRALPLVVHFHGPWADENVAQGDASTLRGSIRRGLERLVYRRAERVVVLSSAFRRLLIERYGVSPWRIRVEPPGVDLERFCPGDRKPARDRFAIDSEAFVAVCVRRLVPRMGLDLLIDAWASALPQLPPGAQLLLAGDGDGALRRELEEQIGRLGLHQSVQLLGPIGDDALVDLYQAADVSVVPTRSFEGFGLVVIEAAACGTPTIVTSVGGLPEAIAGLDRSLIVAAGDVPGLAERIVSSSRAGGLPSRSATRQFAEGYSWTRVVERGRAIFRETIAPETTERRLRVVFLDHVGQLSGGEIALLRLIPHLKNVEPHVILAEGGPFADELALAGISAEVLPMGERARGLRKDSVTPRAVPFAAVFQTAAYTVRLAVRLRRLRPDLVHTNSLKAGVYGSIAARIADIPVVWHVRDRIAADYLPKPAVRLLRAMTRRLPAAVITNSHATMSTLDPKVEPLVFYSVVPEALSAPASRRSHDGGPLCVGMIGRFAPWKGQDLFLGAFADAFPEGNARCILVGAALFGEDEFELRLRAMAEALALGERVDFRGFRPNVWKELAQMDILVHASVIPEPFGQVILEGMASHVPVIAADAGGPAELISHDVNGILYAMGDRNALAAALRKLADDPQQRARLTEAGIATVAGHHPTVIASDLEEVYRRAIRSSRSD